MHKSMPVVLAAAAVAFAAGSAQAAAVYSNLPTTPTYNVPSLGYQATSTSELGDHVALGAGGRNLTTVSVLMSSWALESTYGTGGAGYDHDLTFNLYNVGTSASPGALIASKTISTLVPWRPEADATCPGGTGWRAADGACYSGMAFTVVFDFSADGVVLPDELVFGLAFNTQSYGASPMGATGPYNSLNFGLVADAPTVGTDVDADSLFWNTSHAGFLTSGIAGQFSEDSGWTGYAPSIEIAVADVPEPASIALAGLALAGLAAARRRRA